MSTTKQTANTWTPHQINEELMDKYGIESVHSSPVKHVLISPLNYWVLEHEDGKFSTVVMRDSIIGTFEECKTLLLEIADEIE